MGEMKSTVRLHKNPLKSAGFRVLKAPDVPSVLVELGKWGLGPRDFCAAFFQRGIYCV